MSDISVMRSISRVFSLEQVSGLIIIVAMVLGLATKNSPLAPLYDFAHHATVHLGVGSLISAEPVIFWINEGLMVFFFLLVGTELKRELLDGHLSTFKQAILPAYAAAGGMAAPALIYVAFNWADPLSLGGWAIPTATDIVLALGLLTVLGTRVPVALKAFLMALAIFDDIGAVLIISLFYGKGLVLFPLFVAVLALGGLGLLNRYGIVRVWPYVVIGGALWLAMLGSGFEAALAGVLIGFTVPRRGPSSAESSPLRSVERAVHPWVALLVVPLFAFFNSGVVVDARAFVDLGTPASLGIILGLFLGKQFGIMTATWAATRLGAARLPRGVTWPQIYGAAVIAGIGFTMSLFVTVLAFPGQETATNAKLAVLTASLLSGATGLIILHAATRRTKTSSISSENAIGGK